MTPPYITHARWYWTYIKQVRILRRRRTFYNTSTSYDSSVESSDDLIHTTRGITNTQRRYRAQSWYLCLVHKQSLQKLRRWWRTMISEQESLLQTRSSRQCSKEINKYSSRLRYPMYNLYERYQRLHFGTPYEHSTMELVMLVVMETMGSSYGTIDTRVIMKMPDSSSSRFDVMVVRLYLFRQV